MKAPKARFKILPFTNPRTGTPSWRVTGTRRNGERIRENFAAAEEAQYRHTELEAEFHATNGIAADGCERVGGAEAAFKRLELDEDLLTAVDHWLRTGNWEQTLARVLVTTGNSIIFADAAAWHVIRCDYTC